jgi:hypothetical protein
VERLVGFKVSVVITTVSLLGETGVAAGFCSEVPQEVKANVNKLICPIF